MMRLWIAVAILLCLAAMGKVAAESYETQLAGLSEVPPKVQAPRCDGRLGALVQGADDNREVLLAELQNMDRTEFINTPLHYRRADLAQYVLRARYGFLSENGVTAPTPQDRVAAERKKDDAAVAAYFEQAQGAWRALFASPDVELKPMECWSAD